MGSHRGRGTAGVPERSAKMKMKTGMELSGREDRSLRGNSLPRSDLLSPLMARMRAPVAERQPRHGQDLDIRGGVNGLRDRLDAVHADGDANAWKGSSGTASRGHSQPYGTERAMNQDQDQDQGRVNQGSRSPTIQELRSHPISLLSSGVGMGRPPAGDWAGYQHQYSGGVGSDGQGRVRHRLRLAPQRTLDFNDNTLGGSGADARA